MNRWERAAFENWLRMSPDAVAENHRRALSVLHAARVDSQLTRRRARCVFRDLGVPPVIPGGAVSETGAHA